MIILGIETSCDETAVSIIEVGGDDAVVVRSEQISSQVALHEAYGGVVPELASREHLQNLPLLLDSVLKEGKVSLADVNLIGVTQGPGLKGCLLMGVGFAKALSIATGIPLIGVNHIEGHILSPLLSCPNLQFPFLSLVVSGGHTEILEVRGFGEYALIARTTDDAAGEAFDKSANLLGLVYPGGPRLAELADRTGRTRFQLPKVMRESPGFSFSGLKTAISLLIDRNRALLLDESVRGEICFAVQEAIIDALVFKVEKAIRDTGIKRISVTGGVSANRALRERMSKLKGAELYLPHMRHTTDNATMIAFAAYRGYLRGNRTDLACDVFSRWPVEELAAA